MLLKLRRCRAKSCFVAGCQLIIGIVSFALFGCGGASPDVKSLTEPGPEPELTRVPASELPPKPIKKSVVSSWRPGMYSEYLRTSKEGGWESYKFIIDKKLEDDQWEATAFIKTDKTEIVLKLTIHERGGNGQQPIVEILGYNNIRGPKLDREKYATYFALLNNFFNTRLMYMAELQNPSQGGLVKKSASYPFGINQVSRLEDPWPTFKYTQYHDFSDEVPILGIARIETSDQRFTVELLAFGLNAMEGFSDLPAYVDFDHLEPIEWDGFTLSMPVTWMLSGKDHIEKQNGTFYFFLMGGDNHASNFTIMSSKVEAGKLTKRCNDLVGEFTNYGDDDKSFNYTFIKAVKYKTSSGNDSQLFYHSLENGKITGMQISTFICDESSSRVAELRSQTYFKEDNPLLSNSGKYAKQIETIMKSFKFN